MADQTVFERYEIKYLMTRRQRRRTKYLSSSRKSIMMSCTSGGSRSPSLRRWNGLCRGRRFPRQPRLAMRLITFLTIMEP